MTDEEGARRPPVRRALEVKEWEQRPVAVEHLRPASAEALTVEPAQGILASVGEWGVVLLVQEAQRGLQAGLYFFPWNSVIHIRLLE